MMSVNLSVLKKYIYIFARYNGLKSCNTIQRRMETFLMGRKKKIKENSLEDTAFEISILKNE